MKLSIIVPVYNSGAILSKCIESIITQSFNDWELIIVNDGSTDNSGSICNRFATQPNIKVIHKKNGGLSDARNAGLQSATGDFVTFIDSDDHIASNTLGRLMDILDEHTDVDILEYPIKACRPEGMRTYAFADKTYPCAKDYWLETNGFCHTFACNKLFRRTLFSDVQFPVGKKFEDAWTMPLLLRQNPVVRTTSSGTYQYTWNPGGITATASGADLNQLLQAQITASEILGISLLSKEASRWYLDILNRQLDVSRLLHVEPSLPNRQLPLRVASSTNERIKIIILNILGINHLCRINRLTRRNR